MKGDRMRQAKKKHTIRRLFTYALNHKLKLIFASAAVVVSTIMGLLPPYLIREGIDNYIIRGEIERLWLLAVLMILTVLIKGIFDFAKSYLSEYIAQNIIHDLRVDLYNHLNKLSFSFFDSAQTGDLMSRLTADADTLRQFFSRGSVYISSNVLTIIGIFVIIINWDYRLALIYLLMLPLMIFGMYIYAKRVRPMFKMVRKSFAALTHLLRENFLGIEVIKLFGREKFEEERFKKENMRYISKNLEAAKVSAFWMPYVNFFMGLGTALIIWYGGRLVINQEISLGMLAAFISYISMLLRPVRQTGMLISFGSQAAASAERIFNVLDRKSDVKEVEQAQVLKNVRGEVEYRNVSFAYQKGKEVLKNINLEIKAGETAAVVGPTGAGKTTLLHLLPRFYDPDRGKILIDGKDIKNITLESLRTQIGIVMQHTFLFAASIKENISYGKPEADIEEIKQAAETAQIADFIESLPLGYETPVGERGVTLSGGQKQRLAVARVLLTDPSILILDEPTSSVDAATEQKMNTALNKIMENRTTFVIAHRIWTVKNADKIIVLKDGEIIEKGSYQELMVQNGFFAELQHNFVESGTVLDTGEARADRTNYDSETGDLR
jgi:ABC-type multidrug transport system fused ATPase/permease subunit